MIDNRIDIKHYNRKGEEIDLSLSKNKMHIKEIVEKVINATLQ